MSLPTVVAAAGVRARRWDALVLGSGVHALVAAARMGMAGQRVLVVEEDRARNGFEGLREPFFLAGARDGGAVNVCLKELALSLIDRRRIVEDEPAFQVLGDDLRMDLGKPELASDELVAWGLSKPDAALAFVRALREAAEAERKAMLASPVVRIGRRIARQGRCRHCRSATGCA